MSDRLPGYVALIMDAAIFAAEKHHGQLRRDSGLPYAVHPLRVARLLSDFHTSLAEGEYVAACIAAILHDYLEDCDLHEPMSVKVARIEAKFTKPVADLVLELTSEDEATRAIKDKTEYLTQKLARMSHVAKCVKLADRLDNLTDYLDAATKGESVDRAVAYAHSTARILVNNRSIFGRDARYEAQVCAIMATVEKILELAPDATKSK